MTIYKYKLPVADRFMLKLPEGAAVMHVGVQNDLPVMWAIVNLDKPEQERWFRLFGTGHTIPDDVRMAYRGTYQLHGGAFVGHVFEELV